MASTLDTHTQYCPCDDCRAERNAIAYARNHPDEITIDSERFGMGQVFDSVAAAQQAIRDCGPEFNSVVLTERNGRIYDDRGLVVGRVDAADEPHSGGRG